MIIYKYSEKYLYSPAHDKNMRLSVYSILFLVSIIFATALGVAPANQEFDFEPGKIINISYRVYNIEGKDSIVHASVNGTLSKYIELDKSKIKFRKDQRYGIINAKISLPSQPKTMTGHINMDDGIVIVRAKIIIKAESGLPTGRVIESKEGIKNFLLPMVLLLIIIGNVLYFSIRKFGRRQKLETPNDLLTVLRTIDEPTFREYVNTEKNEFADWLDEIKMPELAVKIYDETNKEQMIKTIVNFMNSEKTQKSKEELQKEMTELKQELDGFEGETL